MDPAIVLAVFPVIFIGELPDKTMFASLVLAARGTPGGVWIGAAGAFLVHVVIAVTIGAGLFALLPSRAVEAVVAIMFGVGAGFAFWESRGHEDEEALVTREAASHRRSVTTAFMVIFVAEWGDLTQILTANLAAHYHSALSVSVGAVLALWAVAAVAVLAGTGIMRRVPVRTVRVVTAVVLAVFAVVAAASAITG